MTFKNDIKALIRSKSWKFMKDLKSEYSNELSVYNWKGFKVHYRPGATDMGALYEILIRPALRTRSNSIIQLKRQLEYWVPPIISPNIIFDIGGNIGTTSIYFSYFFPKAKIYTFEPVKRNYEILLLNTKDIENVKTFNTGLGLENGKVDIFTANDETNTGGFSIYKENSAINQNSSEKIQIRNPADIMNEIGVSKIDLIKIDTEGAEYDILRSIDKDILSNVKWILGELHSIDDYKLLDYLSEWFLIDIQKKLKNPLSFFNACNKKFANKVKWK